ncbi:hypothetical protein P170DRAFT_358130 [Aspergillus steynii IBT 23096]|uniref:Uncharacterized protein n=1 Tax=Aspergillus steynii IBT 23096 TaxID=1392250 RepID=A0A2I2G7I4_9EURO|nr:uncharacterized protein P170DRAFT_358130 [Aspergillus steynii IBT 23096]PLB48813.1 hypothetical protein P170DRAFT_358130 [Aspergillus steynii IBT 23096]
MSSELSVALYKGGVYLHCALFIDGPGPKGKVILHATGSTGRYKFEQKESDPRQSAHLVELIYLCHVKDSDIPAIEDAGKNAVIHNEFPGYNCQNYVIELLEDLGAKEIINGNDKI